MLRFVDLARLGKSNLQEFPSVYGSKINKKFVISNK